MDLLQKGVEPVASQDYPRIVEVWEASVRATHHFVSEEDNQFFRMLFIHPDWRGMGIGRRLLQYAIHDLHANELDVNEQNEQAIGFYTHMGFEVFARSELYGTGKPYPILHMRLRNS